MTLIIVLCSLCFGAILLLGPFPIECFFSPISGQLNSRKPVAWNEGNPERLSWSCRGAVSRSILPMATRLRAVSWPLSGKTAPSALFVHGITWTRYGMLKYMRAFVARGWNVAAIDLAGHGETRAPKKFCPSYGYYEKEDVAAALSELRKLFPDSPGTGLIGESLGAATSLQCIGMEAARLQDPPRFVIADCSFSSIGDELDYRLGKLRISLWLRKPAEIGVSFFAKLARGFSLQDASPKDMVCSSDIPVLFVQWH